MSRMDGKKKTHIHTHTYLHIHTHVTTIEALLSLQPIIPPGMLRRSRCVRIFSLKTYQYSMSARGQLNRENNIPLSPCVPETLVSRDGFRRPVPRQPAHHLSIHTQAESGAYLRDSSRVPRPLRPAGLSSDIYPPRSIEGKSRTKLCQKRPQVPGLGHLQSYARFKGGKTKQGYQRMVGWCRLMVMADGDG